MNAGYAITYEEESSNDGEQSTDQESELGSEANEMDLDASATDSDGGSEIEVNMEDKHKLIKSKSEKVKEIILQRYQGRQGKQLYIRFPHKVPETQEALEQKVKELVPLAIKAHKPRQRYVRFCLIDFASKEDRDTSLNLLKKSIKKGDLKKFAVSIPHTESSDFVRELTERKIKSIENKKAKLRLKKATKNALKGNNFTSTIVVLNLPKNASALQVRELFGNAVDINIKPGKGNVNKNTSIAAVTFPTTLEARNATKKKLYLEGNHLKIKFDNKKLAKKMKCRNFLKNDEISQSEQPTKRHKLKTTFDNAEEKVLTKTHTQNQKSENNYKFISIT